MERKDTPACHLRDIRPFSDSLSVWGGSCEAPGVAHGSVFAMVTDAGIIGVA